MPSPEASALTRRHRSELAVVGRAVVRPVRQLAQGAQVADVDSWFDQVLARLLQIVRAGWLVARSSGARYLREHAALEGRQVEPMLAVWVPQQVETSLRVTGPVEFKHNMSRHGSPEQARRAMAATLGAAAVRQALAGERDTVMRTVTDSAEIVGWRRVTDGSPCAWCAMLASRGAVYRSRASASQVVGRRSGVRGTRRVGESYHDGCGCTVEPLYEHEDDPQSVLDLQEQWRQATAGTFGRASLRAWRRYWDGRSAEGDTDGGSESA